MEKGSAQPLVLIVDDDRLIRQVLRETLQAAGFAVALAADGEEGCRAALEKEPDLILLDVYMPNQDGVTTCRILRSLPKLRTTPIIMMTARPDLRGAVNPFQVGADDYIAKPVDGSEIVGRIQANLAKNRSRQHLEEQLRERQRMEQELLKAKTDLERANEKLRRHDRLRAEFLNTAAHELRMPVTIVNGYCSLLLDSGTDNLTQEQRDYLDAAIASSERLVRLTNNMLDLSRLEAGKMRMQFASHDLARTIQEVCRDFLPLAERGGIVLDAACREECHALFDRDQIHRVMTNLLGNAVKFTPSGGRIQVSVVDETREVQVVVEDTGKGIPRERLCDLFEEFVQVGTQDALRGTGLGLSICRKIIQTHRGRIWVESSPGEGSRFYFTLPKRD